MELSKDESRVIGVLIEKAQTGSSQYPMTLNALTAGCNQKSNRNPVVDFDENRVLDALQSLRSKNLVVMVSAISDRVPKYRHDLREGMGLATSELAVLAELLLRGPQTLGELRTRCNRMHPMESMEVVQNIISHMMSREDPLVTEAPPAPGSRAGRYAQLLCPDLHPLGEAAPREAASSGLESTGGDVENRLDQMQRQIDALTHIVQRLAESLGESQILGSLRPGSEEASESDR